jgi:hypothetical protein
VPEVVSGYVLPVVGKFHARASPRGAPFGPEVSGENPFGNDAEVFEFLAKLVVK